MDKRIIGVRLAVADLLNALGVNLSDPNYVDTPDRYARWVLEHFPDRSSSIEDELRGLESKTFPTRYHGMVTQTGITVNGLCPHHLLPVTYDVAVGYIPKDKAIGLSKLARIAHSILSPAGLQEDGTVLIAEVFSLLLDVEDVAVVVRGVHSCMTVRGIREHDSETTTSEMRGVFLSNERQAKDEFLQIVYNRKGSK